MVGTCIDLYASVLSFIFTGPAGLEDRTAPPDALIPPAFRWEYSKGELRSELALNPPKLQIRFPDGTKDRILLKPHSPLQDKSGLDNECLFLGHVEGIRQSSVAVTGCPGDDEVQVTIVTKSTSGQYLLRGDQVRLL